MVAVRVAPPDAVLDDVALDEVVPDDVALDEVVPDDALAVDVPDDVVPDDVGTAPRLPQHDCEAAHGLVPCAANSSRAAASWTAAGASLAWAYPADAERLRHVVSRNW